MAADHFSSASGRMVWLVYANVPRVISHASSHSSISSSTRMRISSGMPMDGWVSFSWIAFFVGNSLHTCVLTFLKRRTMSRSVADTKKYCCFRRNSLPLYVESDGYSTEVMDSARQRESAAPT